MPYVILLVINAIFVNNFVLSRFLGICPFLGVSRKTDTALGMGMAVIFVMGVASVITYALNLALVAAGIEYLRTIVFILVIACLIQLVEIFVKKFTRREHHIRLTAIGLTVYASNLVDYVFVKTY